MGNRSKSPRYYAVVRGRDGPSIYTTWPEVRLAKTWPIELQLLIFPQCEAAVCYLLHTNALQPHLIRQVSRLSHNMLKKFETMQEARQWLDGMLSIGRSRPTRVAQRVSNHHRHCEYLSVHLQEFTHSSWVPALVKQPDRREPWRPTQFQSQQPQNPLGALAHKTSGLAPTGYDTYC